VGSQVNRKQLGVDGGHREDSKATRIHGITAKEENRELLIGGNY